MSKKDTKIQPINFKCIESLNYFSSGFMWLVVVRVYNETRIIINMQVAIISQYQMSIISGLIFECSVFDKSAWENKLYKEMKIATTVMTTISNDTRSLKQTMRAQHIPKNQYQPNCNILYSVHLMDLLSIIFT